MLAFDNFAETANRFAERNIFALKTGELLTKTDVQAVMDGEIDGFIDSYLRSMIKADE